MYLQDKAISVPPIIIGGTGGSGTRVLGEILLKLNAYLGAVTNPAEDSLSLTPFFTVNLHKAFQLLKEGGSEYPSDWYASYGTCLQAHMKNYSGQSLWGWKNPTSMYYLPFLLSIFPDLKFIHVVRDGRDSATSKNSRQFNIIYKNEHDFSSNGQGKASLWADANCTVADYAALNLFQNYHLLKYEDLCQKPHETISELLRFIEVAEGVEKLVDLVGNRSNISRYLELTESEQILLTDNAKAGLIKFGYMNETKY